MGAPDTAGWGRAAERRDLWRQLSAVLALIGALLWTSNARSQTMADGSLRLQARNASGVSVPLPLLSESMKVVIDTQHATTHIDQRYRNDQPQVVEGLFSFQGGEGAHVSAFAYWNGEQKIVGEVLEKRVAQQLYHDTVQEQRDPGLLEKTGEGSFSFRVYPIQPHENKRIELTVEQWLPRRERVVEYRLPVTGPGAEIDVLIQDDRGVRRVRSTTHRIETHGQGKRVSVRVGSPLDAPVRELVLQYELADRPFQLTAVVHREPGEPAYFVASVAAPHISSAVRHDLTLVLDGGSSSEDLALTKATAHRIVDRLKPGDRLNLIDHRGHGLFDAPRWLSDEVRDKATASIDTIRNSYGRSFTQPLQAALASQHAGPRRRNVMVLTNGGGSNLGLVREALSERGTTRVFALGIGAQSDGALLHRLATLGDGAFVQIGSRMALGPAVDQLASQVAGPVLTKAHLSARGAELLQVYPRGDRVLYQGRELRFVGRLQGDDDATLVLSGQAHEPVQLRTKVELGAARRPWVGMLWGRERVGHLLEEIALHGESSTLVEETTDLALAYNIVTPYTAFLAIPESELSWHDAMTLDEARRRKRALLNERPEVASLMSPAMAGAPPPSEEDMSYGDAPESMDDAAVHGGGCAGCRIGRRETTTTRPLWLLLLVGLMLARRRRAHR